MAAIPAELRADVDACKVALAAVRLGAAPTILCDRLVAMLGRAGVAAAEVVSYLRDAVPSGADRDRVTKALEPFASAPELADYLAAPAKEAAYQAAERARAAAAALEVDALLVGARDAEELEPVRLEIAEREHSVYWTDAAAKLKAVATRQEELVSEKAAADAAALDELAELAAAHAEEPST